jgi:uncharacterized protein involved in outer membrane biogenesis
MATRGTSTSSSTARRIGLGLIGLALLLLLAFGVCEWLEWPFLRAPLERRLSDALARPVAIGEPFGVRLLGALRAHSTHFAIGPSPDGPVLRDDRSRPRDFFEADEVRVALPWSSALALARGRRDEPIVVSSLEVARLDANLLRDADGAANWHFGAQQRKDTEPLRLPRFDRLVVQNGSLRYDDAIARVALDVTLRTHEGGSTPAGLEASASGHWRKSPLKVRLESSGLLPLASQDARAPPVPVKLGIELGATKLDLDGKVADVLHLASLDSRFALVAPSLAAAGDSVGVTLPSTAPFRMNGHIAKAGALWSANIAEFALGSSRLEGEFRYDRSAKRPKLAGRLGGKRLALPDLGPAFGAPNTPDARKQSREASGKLLPQREFDIPALAAMDANVDVDVASFYLGASQLESLAPLKAHVVLADQRLSIERIDARSAGGNVAGTFALDARDRADPRWSTDLRFSGIRLERFIKARDTRRVDAAAEAERRRGGEPPYVSGALSARAQLRGNGRSTAQLLASLDGTAQMWLHDAHISHLLIEASGIDIAESLGLVLSGDSTLPVRCAVARFAVKDGLVKPEVAVIDTADTTLAVTGSVSLAREQLALLVHARPHDMTPVALRGPLHIEGTFAHPELHLDRAEIGVRVAAAAALAAVAAPLASLLAFIDLGDPDKEVCQEALTRMQAPLPRPAAKPARKAAPREERSDGDTAASESARTRPPAPHRTQP